MGKYYSYEDFVDREQYWVASVKATKRHDQLFESLGVNFDIYRILSLLMAHQEGIEPSVIADNLFLLRQAVTVNTDKMVVMGLVERVNHPTDRRKILIKILPAGKDLAMELGGLENYYCEMFYTHFTKDELESYFALSKRMSDVRDEELNKIIEALKNGEEIPVHANPDQSYKKDF